MPRPHFSAHTLEAMRWAALEALDRLGGSGIQCEIEEVSGYSGIWFALIELVQFGLVCHPGRRRGYILTERGKIALALRAGKEARRRANRGSVDRRHASRVAAAG